MDITAITTLIIRMIPEIVPRINFQGIGGAGVAGGTGIG
jgi:hypothetical protein